MTERTLEFDPPTTSKPAADDIRAANERAEAELASLKAAQQQPAPLPSTSPSDGESELRKEPMMVRLMDALAAGEDVGHYGRLVFAMVARHFMPQDDVLQYLAHDRDFSEEQARAMLQQVESRDYTPPRRERLVEWQSEQSFQFLDPADPDSGNLYRHLKFPRHTYDHIEHYQEEKANAA